MGLASFGGPLEEWGRHLRSLFDSKNLSFSERIRIGERKSRRFIQKAIPRLKEELRHIEGYDGEHDDTLDGLLRDYAGELESQADGSAVNSATDREFSAGHDMDSVQQPAETWCSGPFHGDDGYADEDEDDEQAEEQYADYVDEDLEEF